MVRKRSKRPKVCGVALDRASFKRVPEGLKDARGAASASRGSALSRALDQARGDRRVPRFFEAASGKPEVIRAFEGRILRAGSSARSRPRPGQVARPRICGLAARTCAAEDGTGQYCPREEDCHE